MLRVDAPEHHARHPGRATNKSYLLDRLGGTGDMSGPQTFFDQNRFLPFARIVDYAALRRLILIETYHCAVGQIDRQPAAFNRVGGDTERADLALVFESCERFQRTTALDHIHVVS